MSKPTQTKTATASQNRDREILMNAPYDMPMNDEEEAALQREMDREAQAATASQKTPKCDHNEMVRDPVGKYGYWMCAKCFRPYGEQELPQHMIDRLNAKPDWANEPQAPLRQVTIAEDGSFFALKNGSHTLATSPIREPLEALSRAYNHADALAEALRDALKYADSATEHPENKAAFRRIITKALAAYESEVRP